MAKTILLIAAPQDYEDLMAFCSELGLHTLPMSLGKSVALPAEGPVCFLGFAKESELHPYGSPPVRISDVKDPLLLFVRPYYAPPYLTDGQISLNEDNKAVSEQIRPAFEKIRRWVKKNWHKTEEFASYIGPEAVSLLGSKAAQWRSNLHAAERQVVITK